MTTKRVTKEEKQQRHLWAMKKIDQGVGFSELASLVAETWGWNGKSDVEAPAVTLGVTGAGTLAVTGRTVT